MNERWLAEEITKQFAHYMTSLEYLEMVNKLEKMIKIFLLNKVGKIEQERYPGTVWSVDQQAETRNRLRRQILKDSEEEND